MTDDAILVALDRRGDRAGAARRALLADVPVPPFDPTVERVGIDEPDRRSTRWVVLAGAAVLALVVLGAAIWLASDGERDGDPVDRPTVGAPGPYVVDPPPDGLALADLDEPRDPTPPLTQMPRGPEDGLAERATLYGGPQVGRAGLAVVVVTDDGQAEVDGVPMPSAVVGLGPLDLGTGRTAWRTPSPDPFDRRPFVIVRTEDGTLVRLSRAAPVATLGDEGYQVAGLLDDLLLDAARGVTAGGVVPDDALPQGWVALGSAPTDDLLGLSGEARAARGSASDGRWATTYTADGADPELGAVPPDQLIRVSVGPGDGLAWQARRFWASAVDEVEVQGRAALLVPVLDAGQEPPVAGWTVSWRDGDRIVDLAGTADASTLLALAERVRPATAAETDELVAVVMDLAVERAGDDVIGRGRFTDGREWAFVAIGGPGITDSAALVLGSGWSTMGCTEVADETSGLLGSVCTGTTADGVPFALGRATEAVAELALIDLDAPDGPTEVDRVPVLRDGDRVGWLVELPDPDHRYEIVTESVEGGGLGSQRLGG